MSAMTCVSMDNVGVCFRARAQKRVSLKEYLIHHLFRESVNPYKRIQALTNLNLTFREGERIGVIGHNGAGKSTLLRLLSGIYAPTEGRIEVNGNIGNLLDISLGVEPEADGWTNIALRSYLQGASQAQLDARKQEIADFSELGEHLNYPLRTYSSGMIIRLCFSVATAIEPDILILDEVLSTGDLAFQQKAKKRMMNLIEKTRLVVFASHDLHTLREVCTRVVWMEKGQVRADGEPDDIIDQYIQQIIEEVEAAKAAA